MEYFRLSMIWSVVILAVFTSETASDIAVDPHSSSLPQYGLIQRNALLSKKFLAISVQFERAKTGGLQQSVKDSVLDEQYKPWGAASLPNPNPGNQVILDKVDDDLFTPNSEVHTYDQQRFRYQR